MAKLSFAEIAKTDIKEIWRSLAEIELTLADRILDELYNKFLLLAQNPKIGRKHDEILINLRTFPHKKYIIFYFPTEEGIEVYRVLHGARNLQTLFEEYFTGLEP